MFGAWLVGAGVSEAIAHYRDSRRSLQRSVVFLATAAILFLGAPVTVLVVKDYARSLEMSHKMTLWQLGLGPVLLIATAAALWVLVRNRRWLPIALLVATSIVLLWFAWKNDWFPSTLTAIVAAAIQLYAATLLTLAPCAPTVASCCAGAFPSGQRAKPSFWGRSSVPRRRLGWKQ